MPYQPIGKPVCVTTPEQMFNKLNARLKKAGEPAKQDSDDLKTTGSDQPSPPGLVWSQPKKGLGFIYIDAGPYRITRQGKKYECHRECYYLGTRDNAEAAKEFCATHFATQAQSVTT